jgi:soluble lytic murein transglycosylase-like protein
VSVTRRRLIVAASALGLGLGIASQAIGAPADAPVKQRLGAPWSGVRHADHTKLTRWTEAERYPTPESVGVSSATLSAIASCESGGDPTAVSADGAYHGKYQFDDGTWASVGGSGDPAAALEAEQDYRAALLYARGGSSPWPSCG